MLQKELFAKNDKIVEKQFIVQVFVNELRLLTPYLFFILGLENGLTIDLVFVPIGKGVCMDCSVRCTCG